MSLPVVNNLCSYIPICVCSLCVRVCEGSCLGGCVRFSSEHVSVLTDVGRQIILGEVHFFIHESLLTVQSAVSEAPALSLFCNLCVLLTQCFSNFLGQTEHSLKFYYIQQSYKKSEEEKVWHS